MSLDVQLYSQFTDPLLAVKELGSLVAKSGLFGCDRAEQGQALMLICMSERKSPTEILRNYDLVQGRLRKKALAMLADFRARGGKHVWINTGDAGDAAELALEFEGSKITVRFTLADAKKQGTIKPGSAWEKTPGNMLRARCISNGVAMLCPEIVAGSEEESESSPPTSASLDLTPRVVKVVELAPAQVVEVVTTASRADEAELASAGLAPATPAPAVTVPAPVAIKAAPVTDSDRPITQPGADPSVLAVGAYVVPATAGQLEELIGPHYDKAMAWFVREKWLAEGESILRLTETRARRVIAQKSSWLRAIGAEVAL